MQRVVNHVDAILSTRERPEATWWVGERTTPGLLADDLLELGLEPDEPPEMRSLTIARAPRGEPEVEVEVRRVETLEEFLQALEIDWEVFERRRGRARAAPRGSARGVAPVPGRRHALDLSRLLDGEPVGFARVVFTPTAW